MGYEIDTYPEMDKFMAENEKLGHVEGDFSEFDIENIWICELFQNQETKKYSILITRDSDEGQIVFDVK